MRVMREGALSKQMYRGKSFETKLNLWKKLSLNFNKSLKQVTTISNQLGKIPLGAVRTRKLIEIISKVPTS